MSTSSSSYDPGRRPRHARGTARQRPGRQALCRHDDQRLVLPDDLLRVPQDLLPAVRGEDRHQGQFQHAGLPGLQPAHRPRAVDQGLGARRHATCTFIYSGRWIGAGWFTNLDNFIKDAKYTPADWDAEDFAGGPQSAMKNAKGETFGFPWEAGAMIMAAARYDLIEQAGLGMPKTFDELIKVCEAVHNKEDVAAFIADKLHHWNWIPYLMGLGGAVFQDPPDNLTPTSNTPAGREVGRVVRQPPDEVRAGRRPVLFRRPGDALADVGPRQHPHPGDHLDGAARQARREHGARRPCATR